MKFQKKKSTVDEFNKKMNKDFGMAQIYIALFVCKLSVWAGDHGQSAIKFE